DRLTASASANVPGNSAMYLAMVRSYTTSRLPALCNTTGAAKEICGSRNRGIYRITTRWSTRDALHAALPPPLQTPERREKAGRQGTNENHEGPFSGSVENKPMQEQEQEQDQDVIREFLVESHENLSRLDQELVELEKRPKDVALLGSIFRTIHTIRARAASWRSRHSSGSLIRPRRF
ncbi:MAG: hypothetical protein ACRD96_26690, partial [Bryobacteraceae bacterium]